MIKTVAIGSCAIADPDEFVVSFLNGNAQLTIKKDGSCLLPDGISLQQAAKMSSTTLETSLYTGSITFETQGVILARLFEISNSQDRKKAFETLLENLTISR